MQAALLPLLEKGMKIFLDDWLICSPTQAHSLADIAAPQQHHKTGAKYQPGKELIYSKSNSSVYRHGLELTKHDGQLITVVHDIYHYCNYTNLSGALTIIQAAVMPSGHINSSNLDFTIGPIRAAAFTDVVSTNLPQFGLTQEYAGFH